MYAVDYSPVAAKQLAKMDRQTAALVYGWIEKHLVDCENPRAFGKALVGDMKGFWRYRVGDYRLLARIHDDALVILFVNIGHRKEIYK
ncbi:type II toxin-antitoxin system RelE/ParE family toxin [Ruminococcaceae bacterium OttesenSCG-928-I18]|nr:type II toxin-antitoxin system RelE/ParE family toxin [Ruminococcaceae bacterium OttesenSCG-928-I18]